MVSVGAILATLAAAANADSKGAVTAAIFGFLGVIVGAGLAGWAAHVRERRQRVEGFGAWKRGVYRDFLEHLDRYFEAKTDPEKLEWRGVYYHRLNTLMLSAGQDLLGHVRAFLRSAAARRAPAHIARRPKRPRGTLPEDAQGGVTQ